MCLCLDEMEHIHVAVTELLEHIHVAVTELLTVLVSR